MSNEPTVLDYESLGPTGSSRRRRELAADWTAPAAGAAESEVPAHHHPTPSAARRSKAEKPIIPLVEEETWWNSRRGHTLSYCGFVVFTIMLYFRPYEYIPALASMSSLAFWPAIFTLAVFFPTQMTLEGNLTARPREVNFVLLLCAGALLSMPLAINPVEAWGAFNEVFIKAVLMFLVIINAVRTERRLRVLLLLVMAVSLTLSYNALNDYRLGNFAVEGYRVRGSIGGMFGNPNDMALHLVTIVPIAVGFFLNTRNGIKKLIFAGCGLLYVIAIVVTFSRGGFLGLAGVAAFLAWKISRKNRIAVVLLLVLGAGAFLALAPGEYAGRLASISNFSLDPNGSANARQALLTRSILVTLNNPIFGVGIGNFHTVSIHEQVSHNAYTQVSAEMGIASMVMYVLFILAALKGLRRVERETFGDAENNRFYYLAVCLQASLIGYMISSFFASVAYHWYIYYLVGYAVVLRRLYVVAAQQNLPVPTDDERLPI